MLPGMPPRVALTKGSLELQLLPRANHPVRRELTSESPGPKRHQARQSPGALVLGPLDIRICTCDSRESGGAPRSSGRKNPAIRLICCLFVLALEQEILPI